MDPVQGYGNGYKYRYDGSTLVFLLLYTTDIFPPPQIMPQPLFFLRTDGTIGRVPGQSLPSALSTTVGSFEHRLVTPRPGFRPIADMEGGGYDYIYVDGATITTHYEIDGYEIFFEGPRSRRKIIGRHVLTKTKKDATGKAPCSWYRDSMEQVQQQVNEIWPDCGETLTSVAKDCVTAAMMSANDKRGTFEEKCQFRSETHESVWDVVVKREDEGGKITMEWGVGLLSDALSLGDWS